MIIPFLISFEKDLLFILNDYYNKYLEVASYEPSQKTVIIERIISMEYKDIEFYFNEFINDITGLSIPFFYGYIEFKNDNQNTFDVNKETIHIIKYISFESLNQEKFKEHMYDEIYNVKYTGLLLEFNPHIIKRTLSINNILT